jgi:chromosome segregation and condensation protein ScpB
VSDSDAERSTKRVAEIVRTAGAEGISRSDLVRKCFFLRARERDETIQTLLQAGLVVEQMGPSTGGRRPVRYVRVGT